MSTEKVLDAVVAFLISVASIFLFKHVLNSVGAQYQLEFFANLGWREYWGVSSIVSLYLISTVVSLNDKSDKGESKDFKKTANALGRILSILIIWGLSSLVAHMFFI